LHALGRYSGLLRARFIPIEALLRKKKCLPGTELAILRKALGDGEDGIRYIENVNPSPCARRML
jgi:hypothetical protein